jgi:P-type Ca2+ transporter type 2C
VIFSLSTHVLVIYVPFLQTAFHTVALSATDWLVVTGVSATLLVIVELVKLVLRMKRPRLAHPRSDGHGHGFRLRRP